MSNCSSDLFSFPFPFLKKPVLFYLGFPILKSKLRSRMEKEEEVQNPDSQSIGEETVRNETTSGKEVDGKI